MSLSVPCPHCQHVNELPDQDAGKIVRCTECGQAFETPPIALPLGDSGAPRRSAAPSSALGIPMSAWKALSDDTPAREDDDIPPRPFGPPSSRRSTDWETLAPEPASHPALDPGWGKAAAGLKFLGVLALLFLGANVLTGCIAVAEAPFDKSLVILYPVASLIALLLCLLGLWDCCAVPAQSGVRGLTHATTWMTLAGTLLLGLGLLLSLFTYLTASPATRYGRSDEVLIVMVTGMIYLLAGLLLLAGFIMFLFVLRGMAVFFGDPKLAQAMITYFLVLLCTPVVGAIVLVCAGAILDSSRDTRKLIPLVAWGWSLLLATVLTIWFYNLVRDTRRRIDMARQNAG